MKIMKKRYLLIFIALGGLVFVCARNGLEIKKDLRRQPSLYMISCSDVTHGLFSFDGDLKNKTVLSPEQFDLFAGLDYLKRENKMIAYVIDKGITEYDLSANKSQILLTSEEVERYEEELKPEKKGNLQLYEIRYCPDSDNISFIYGNWGMAGGEGKLYLYDRERKEIREICRLDTGGGYCWSQDGKRIYFIRDAQLFCRNLITGDEERLLEDVINFSVSEQEQNIAVWREKRYDHSRSYRLSIYDKKTGEKHIVNSPYWGRLAFSPDGRYLAYLSSKSGVLGSILEGKKPTLSVYDRKRNKTVKNMHGGYDDIWGDVSW